MSARTNSPTRPGLTVSCIKPSAMKVCRQTDRTVRDWLHRTVHGHRHRPGRIIGAIDSGAKRPPTCTTGRRNNRAIASHLRKATQFGAAGAYAFGYIHTNCVLSDESIPLAREPLDAGVFRRRREPATCKPAPSRVMEIRPARRRLTRARERPDGI